MDGIALADREVFAAIGEGREPKATAARSSDALQTLDRFEVGLALAS